MKDEEPRRLASKGFIGGEVQVDIDESEYSFYQSAPGDQPHVEIRHTRSETTVFELRDHMVDQAIDDGLISHGAKMRSSIFAYAREIGAFAQFERELQRSTVEERFF